MKIIEFHARAILCHCECLGMNSANMMAAIADIPPPYGDVAYIKAMKSYGLLDERGQLIELEKEDG